MLEIKRFLICCRGTVALESALATFPLMLCLAGAFEVVQTIFTRDLVQRAAYRVARTNALAATPASTTTDMLTRIQQAINTEVGSWLDYTLRLNSDCPDPSNSPNPTAEYCVSAKIEVYSSPGDLASGQQAVQDDTTGYGGGTGETVVVRLYVKPQSLSGQLKQAIFGAMGPEFRSVVVMRNEERTP